MRRSRVRPVVVALILATTGCSTGATITVDPDPPASGTFRGGTDRPGRSDPLAAASGAAGPATAWSVDATGPVIASPVAADGVVVIPLGDGELVAIEPADGTVRWQVPIPDADASAVVVGDHAVVASLDGTLAAHALADGSATWSVDLGGRVRSSPLLVGEQVVVGVDDAVVARAADDGSEAWRRTLDGRVDGSAALAGDRILIGDTANHLWSLDRAGEVAAEVDLGPVVDGTFVPGIAATPTVAADMVVVGSTNGTLLAADVTTLAARWTVDLDGAVYASVAVDDVGEIGFISDDTGTVTALELAGGTIVWQADVGDAVYASPTLAGGPDPVLLVLEEGGSLVGLDPADGTERWRAPVGEDGNYMSSTPIVVDGTVVVGTNTGDVLGLR